MTFSHQSLTVAGVEYRAGGPVYVIAEIGSNHDGSLERAIEMIGVAARAGADAAKFQSFTAETLVANRAAELRKAFAPLALPPEWLPDLASAATAAGVHFVSTAFSSDAVQAIAASGAPAIKIASGDLTHHALLRATAETGLPVIVSSGAATIGDVERSVAVLRAAGCEQLAVTHCVSSYPPRLEEMNLRAMASMALAFDVAVGLSDHTPGAAVSTAAVALGACVIEKHLTLDRSLPGPDHPYALQPDEFEVLVASIRAVELALGDGVKQPAESEAAERYWAWRGLYAARDLPEGTIVTTSDLVALRPRESVGADEEHLVLGRVVRRGLRAGDAITLDAL